MLVECLNVALNFGFSIQQWTVHWRWLLQKPRDNQIFPATLPMPCRPMHPPTPTPSTIMIVHASRCGPRWGACLGYAKHHTQQGSSLWMCISKYQPQSPCTYSNDCHSSRWAPQWGVYLSCTRHHLLSNCFYEHVRTIMINPTPKLTTPPTNELVQAQIWH